MPSTRRSEGVLAAPAARPNRPFRANGSDACAPRLATAVEACLTAATALPWARLPVDRHGAARISAGFKDVACRPPSRCRRGGSNEGSLESRAGNRTWSWTRCSPTRRSTSPGGGRGGDRSRPVCRGAGGGRAGGTGGVEATRPRRRVAWRIRSSTRSKSVRRRACVVFVFYGTAIDVLSVWRFSLSSASAAPAVLDGRRRRRAGVRRTSGSRASRGRRPPLQGAARPREPTRREC